MILAGDIGGTKTNLALFEADAGGRLTQVDAHTFVSHQYGGLEQVVAEFLSDRKNQLESACFGIAGPVVDGVCETPNLPWVVRETSLASELGIQGVRLINDLEATAHGVDLLGPGELISLNPDVTTGAGTRALIAAGTGLGQAGLISHYDGTGYDVIASEGGHTDFAPRNDTEIELLKYLLRAHGHVSYERVVSGPGLANIYEFLRSQSGSNDSNVGGKDTLPGAGDMSARISQLALDGEDDLAVRSLDIFAEIYGAQAGNLALTLKATGGVYLGGGIAPKIIKKLMDGTFMKAFTDKGRLSPLVKSIPVAAIMNPRTALNGAARNAVGLRT